MNEEIRSITIGFFSGLGILLVFGIPTALIPIGVYTRMIQVTLLDYFFLLASSALIGVYAGLWNHSRRRGKQTGNAAAMGGGVSSFLAVSCPVCNVLLVSLIGVSSVMVFVEPLRPVLGIAGIVLLGTAVYYKYVNMRSARINRGSDILRIRKKEVK